jgi:hypothetical protein
MKIREDDISQVNLQLKDSLQKWSDILVHIEDNELGYLLEFNESDLLNVLSLFMNIWSNSAIKRGIFTEDNVIPKMKLFSATMNDVFGVDTTTLADSVFDNNNCELN